MKLSVLIQNESSPSRVAAPIFADTVSFKPPKGLLVAGFVHNGGSSVDEIDENLVDTVVSWSSFGNAASSLDSRTECVMELDWKTAPPPEDAVFLAASGEFSLALVGQGKSGGDMAGYCLVLESYVSKVLKTGNFSKSLYPFSPVFEMLFLEAMGKLDDAQRIRREWSKGLVDVLNPAGAQREYALVRTPLGAAEVEAACRSAVLSHFGSEDSFFEVARALALPVAKRISDYAHETLPQAKARQEAFNKG